MSFVHLHSHSYYSLLDGLGSPAQMVKAVKEQGATALGITDHGVLYGAIEFYKVAKSAGIKPVIGCEMYVAQRSRFDKTPQVDVKPYHLTVLAATNEGYQNLLTLVTKAHLEGFYYKPRIDLGLLKAHGKGLIVLSGCLASELSRTVLSGDMKEAVAIIRKYQDVVGPENYYLELQDHPLIEEQQMINEALIKLSKQTDAKLVATNDAHYVYERDSDTHDILMCIQTQTTIHNENRIRYHGDFSLRSPEDMKQTFSHVPQAIESTLEIADRCNVEIPFGQNLLPSYKTPNGQPPAEYLKQLCEEGLRFRYGDPPSKEAVERLFFELSIVHQMGFDSYFLIVHDFVKFAKDNVIVVGPGRGSAAGSIMAYVLRITELDPLKYGLLFERFLNPARISMPDIDIDFADNRRDEVLNYVVQKYGRENVAQIITFGTMAARACVRDTGRALGYSYADVDRIAKLIPPPILGKHEPLADSIQNDPDLRSVYGSEPRTKSLLDQAVKLEGTVRHAGTHACAVVISEKPLIEYTALQYATGEKDRDDVITQYSMKPVEELGLLKMDFLGLKNLTLLEKTITLVSQMHGVSIDLATIPLDDAHTFELLKEGQTTGVFQLESAGMKRYLKQLKPTKFEDIIAMVSLYRPGPMEWIPIYIRGKHHLETVKYLDKSFESILKETYGVAVYQEQILQISQQFAGFTLGEADILRKAVGKKIPELLQEQRAKFVEGAVKKGHEKAFAERVFEDVIEPFAGYGFNKAHAACYGMIAYQTAYLKAHYPVEFMTALLTCDQDNSDRVVLEICECEEMGIHVLPPSVNESFKDFTVVSKEKIRFGLSAIKGLGDETIQKIIQVREKSGHFASLEDFAKQMPYNVLNKKMIESLAYSGAMDELGDRLQIAENYDEIVKYARYTQESRKHGQIDLFDLLEVSEKAKQVTWRLKKVEPVARMQKLKWEKEYLGLYVTSHPLQGLKKYLSKKAVLLEQLTKKDIGKTIKIGGLIAVTKKVTTKQGVYMMMATLEDPTGRINVIVFPKVYHQYADAFREDQIVILEGKLDFRRGEYQFICEAAKIISLEKMIESAKADGFFDEKEKLLLTPKKSVGHIEKNDKNDEDPGASPPEIAIEESAEAYVIELQEHISPEVLTQLKQILTGRKGSTLVEILIHEKNRIKRIRVPFGVHVDEDLKNSIREILTKAS